MVDFVEYVVSELKSRRLGKANALDLIRQFFGRRAGDAQLHPLVHRNVSTLSRQCYRSRFGGGEFFLRDHRVRMADGVATAVLPGVAYLEMARAALADAVPDLAAESTLAFEDVLWLAPFAVGAERELLIELEAEDDGLAFCAFSEDAAGLRTDHASGHILFYDGLEDASQAEALDLDAVRASMQRAHWDATSVYDTYARVGIDYGPAHRGIVDLDSGEGQVLARLALPASLEGEDNAAFVLHPSLLDSALQAAIGLGDRDAAPAEPMLPFALESLSILGPCPDRMLAFVRRSGADAADGSQLTLDLDLCDEDGVLCVQLRGFRARRFDTRGLSAAAAELETLVAVPAWDAPAARATAPAAWPAQRQVLICDLGGVDAQALAALLPGVRVDVLDAGDSAQNEGREADAGGSDASAAPALRYERLALRLFSHLQAVLRAQPATGTLLQCVVADDAQGAFALGLEGMLKTAAQENPALSVQLVALDAAADLPRIRADLDDAAAHAPRSPLRYTAEGRRGLEWHVSAAEAGTDADADAMPPYREGGVYVVTGGLGGLGLLLAGDILSRTRHAQLVLTGRAAPGAELDARLQATGLGERLHYRRLDLLSLDDCRRFFADVAADIGGVRGVFHCAGMRDDEVLLKKSAESVSAVLAPKVRGTWNLDQASAEADLDVFVLFSSGVAVFGNVGQADYAAANGFLDIFAAYRDGLVAQGLRHGRSLAIDWPLWDAGGMRLDAEAQQWLQARSGMRPMRTETGLAVLRRALLAGDVQVLAVEGDGRRLRRLFDAPTPARAPAPQPARQAPPQAAASAAPAPAQVEPASGGDLLGRCREFLRREFAPVLRIAPSQIDIQEPLEGYGINSILAMSLTAQLEKHFGPLSKTLFFEYQTIAALSEHLVQAHAQTLQTLFNPGAAPAPAAIDTAPARVAPAAVQADRAPARAALRGKTSAPALVRRGPSSRPASNEAIAIVGLSGRYPESYSLDDFWRNLRDGIDCVIEVPAERWRWQDYYTDDRDTPGHYSKWGGFVRGADEFDPQFFNISPREAPYIDPQERLFLQHAWMAIEDAGYSRRALRIPRADGLPGQVGVYAGVMYGEYNRSGSLASIANRVSYVLNVHGPSMTLDTMCSSSLTAIHLACQDLRSGRTDMALAGGVNLSLHPGKYSMLSAGQFISTAGQCQSFGEGGDGYIPGEGVGVVVLKRLSDAERDGDAIHAVIRGSALNHGGKTNGYTVPNPQAQAAVVSEALKVSGVDARHVSYIEAHGTGTKLGDPIEIAALGKAFREYTQETGFCQLGSAKSNIGHCESAAGIAGLTKVVLQLRHRRIVPSLHSAKLNPNIDFDTTPFVVNQTLREWEAPVLEGRLLPRIAGLSSFGAGGANAHFVVEEYAAPAVDALAHAGIPVIVPLSARTADQLERKARDLLEHLKREAEAGTAPDHLSLAWTLQVGRDAMEERVAFVVDSTAGLQHALEAYVQGDAASAYRGQVKANKDMLRLLVADSDYEDVLEKWIAQRKLEKLAELWSKGLDLEWSKFHERQRPRRLHLPTYPFAQERYWIDPMQGLFPVDAGAQTLARQALHALLHENTSDLEQLRYSSVFAPGQFAGEGEPLPLQTLQDLARAAVARAAGSPGAEASVALGELTLGATFVPDGQTALHIVLFLDQQSLDEQSPDGHDAIAFDIYSGDGEGTVHAQGSGRVDAEAVLPASAQWSVAAAMPPAQSAGASLPSMGTPVLHKPNAIVLLAPAQAPVVVDAYRPKPNASRLASLAADVVAFAPSAPPVVAQSGVQAAPVAAVAPAAPAVAEAVTSSAGREDLRVFLKRTLAQALYLDENAIDDDRSFVDLGLDSIVGVEWVKSINKGLGLEIGATRVYDYSNVAALAAYLQTQLPDADAAAPASAAPTAAAPAVHTHPITQASTVQAPAPAFAPPAVPEAPPMAPAPAPVAARASASVSVAAPPAAAGGIEGLLPELRRTLAQALYLDESAIDDDRSFIDLGLDSIVGVEWVKTLNKAFGLEISATRVYDYANLHALASYLHGELQRVAPERIPAAAAMPADTPSAPQAPVAPPAAPSAAIAHAVSLAPPAQPVVANGGSLRRRGRGERQVAPAVVPAVASATATQVDDRVAIVGMSARYPDARDLGEFWRNLLSAKNSIREVPRERWNVDDYYDPTPGKPGKIYCKWLGALDDIASFDPMFFQISPSEAEIMDPQHRLFMQEGYRAFQDAGYSSAALSNRKCGVYMGIMSGEYSFLLAKGNPLTVETTGNSFAIGAARIAYHLNLKGPAIPIDTACSSSLVAMHLARKALLDGEIDMALAGGVSLYLIPESYLGMCRAGMLSKDGQCKTFDNGADGFVPGEGVGTVVLKRLSDAERDGDHIYGVIIGSGINQDGKTNGITAPSVNSQIDLLRDIYRRHGIDASTINYVETHGTGTKLGDPIELEALTTVFREHNGGRNACALGAVKTNLGHVSGAAGVAGVHKVLLSMRHGQIAPNVNLQQENVLFDFATSPFYPSRSAHEWRPAAGGKRRAAVSSFGFSGTNAHVVIEEYVPAQPVRPAAPRTCIVPLSARSEAQLQTMAGDLLSMIEASGREPGAARFDLVDLAWSLQAGRDQMRERCAWVVDSLDALKAALEEFVIAPVADGRRCHRGSVGRAQDGQAATEQAAALRREDATRQSAALAALWVKGADLDWSTFYPDVMPRRVSQLPGYPFARERCWVDIDQGAPVAALQTAQPSAASSPMRAAAAPAVEAPESVCYVPTWRNAPLAAARQPFAAGDVLLVLDRDEMLFERLKSRPGAASALKAVVLIRIGEGALRVASDQYTVDPAHPEQMQAALEALRADGLAPTHVVHNADAARLPSDADALDGPALDAALGHGVDAVFGLCKALMTGGARQSPCVLVSFHHAGGDEDASLARALAAFYRSLSQENNRYSGRTVVFESASDAAPAHDTLALLLDELQAPGQNEAEVRYLAPASGAATRSVRVPTLQPLATAVSEAPLKQGGTYLITGGLGGLGVLFAAHLAERYRAKLVLSGRSTLDARGTAVVERLRALGAEVEYVAADVADAQQAQALLDRARQRFGGLHGVLHSAGINDDALLLHKSRESLHRVLAPKVRGTLNLDRLTAGDGLDLFVLFSSGAGSFGNAGQTDYAYANAFLDGFAEHRERLRARGVRCGRSLSIGWPYWHDGGMHLSSEDLQRIEARTGLMPLSTQDGIAYWEHLLRSDLTHALALHGRPGRIASHCDPSSAQAAVPVAAAIPQQGAAQRLSAVQAYLSGLVHAETKIPVERIDIEERFEAYGFDSIMIGRFNATLESDLGELPKTLMYEFETVAELAAHLCERHAQAVDGFLARSAVASGAASAAALSVSDGGVPAVDAAAATPVPAMQGGDNAPIAIIGVHVQFPQSDGLEAFWSHLQAGRDLVSLVPEERWDAEAFYDPDPAQAEHGSIYCKWGGFIDDFDRFDAAFFNIPAREADILDPQERRFLQSAWAAVEDAGYTRERLKQRHPKGKSADVGVFVGVTTNTYQLLAPEAWQRGEAVTPSAMPWSIANRVSYALDLQGPSMPVDTACSSSLVAVHLACESLRRGECQAALAGGVNLYLHPAKYQSFCQRRMLAVGDKCRSYGDGDDGFIPGEGVGTLMLKPLRLAERDGDPIYGVIRGSAYDHSGRSNGYATPNPNAQAQVIAEALERGGVPARSIGFIEGHGTGTRMGDSLEVAAISQAFSRQTDDRQFCALGSLKANIGHAESATSIAGIAKVLMQFRHRQIAPSIHAETVNPDIDFARSPCVLQTRLAPWEAAAGQPRRALVNAFGAGGVNACAVLEEYLPQPASAASANVPAGGPQLFVVSAMNALRLREYVEAHLERLATHPQTDLSALCRTVQRGREALTERLALLVHSTAQLRDALAGWLSGGAAAVPAPVQCWHGRPDGSAASGREARERMHALCEARDLPALAQVWVQGGKVEWERLQPATPSATLAGVPVYPFARDRHWAIALDVGDVDGSASARAALRGGATAPPRLHPLLSHNVSTLARVGFDAMLDLGQYYARDHRIQNQAVFPGAGFLEMACVAATLAGQRRVRRLKDIFWVQPLALGESTRNPTIRLKDADRNGAGFVVTTLDADHEDVVHCEGRALFTEGTPRPAPSMQAWRQRCGATREGAAYYALFERLGFQYGPAFQVIEEIATGEGCAMARLSLHPQQAGDFDQYVLHPSLIDGALQAVVALLAAGEGGVPHLPFAIDEIEIYGGLTRHCHVLIERSGGDGHDGILQFDLLIVSDEGEALVRIGNFYVRALVPPAAAAPARAEDARHPMAVTP